MSEFPEFQRRVARLIAEPPVAPTPVSELHERARSLRRRRRSWVGLFVLVAAAATVIGAWPRGSRSTLVQVAPAPSPTVAYVASDGVHVTGTGRVIGGPGATRPRWSPDGTWIAYQDSANALWVARPDGGAAREIEDQVHRWDWAPRGAHIAVVHGNSYELTVVDAERDGPWSPPGRVDDFTWSADGSRIAYSVLIAPRAGGWVDDVFIARLDTPERFCLVLCPDIRQVVFNVGGRDVDTSVDVGVYFAGWSPDGRTLLVWPDENHSGSIAMDGLPLHELPVAGGPTRPLTRTLVRRDWIAWSPDGRRVLTVESGGRMRGDAPRRIVDCVVATASCRAIADEAVDPARSADGSHITFVHAAEHPPNNPDAWPSQYGLRTLVIVTADGGRRQDVPATSGAASPRWLDNRNILLVHDGGLWIVDPTTGRHTMLVGTIGVPNDVPPRNAYEATDLVGYAWTNAFDAQPATNTAPPTTTTAAAPTAGPCTGPQLRLTLARDVGSLMQQPAAFFGLTNRSATSCSLDGYPALTLYDEAGRRISTTIRHGTSYQVNDPGPHVVTVQPGESAYFGFGWVDVNQPDGTTNGCARIAQARVLAPNTHLSLTTAARLSSLLCGGGGNVTAIAPAPRVHDRFSVAGEPATLAQTAYSGSPPGGVAHCRATAGS